MIATPSLPAANHYLHRSGVIRAWNPHLARSRHGYAYYFTVFMPGGRFAHLMKVCEDTHGRVIGATNLSAGEPDCDG